MAGLVFRVVVLGIGLGALNEVKKRFFRKPRVHSVPDDFCELEKDEPKQSLEDRIFEDATQPDSFASPPESLASESHVYIPDEESSVCRSLVTCLSRTLSNLTEEEEIKFFLDQWEAGDESPTTYEDSLYLDEDHRSPSPCPFSSDLIAEPRPSLVQELELEIPSEDEIGAPHARSLVLNVPGSHHQGLKLEEPAHVRPTIDDIVVVEQELVTDEKPEDEECVEELLLNLLPLNHDSCSPTLDEQSDWELQEALFEYNNLYEKIPFYEEDSPVGLESSDFDTYDSSFFAEGVDSITVSEMIEFMEQEQQAESAAEAELLDQLDAMDYFDTPIPDHKISKPESSSNLYDFSSLEDENHDFFSQLLQILDSSGHMVAEIDDLFHRETIDQFLESVDFLSETIDYIDDAGDDLSVPCPPTWVDLILEPSAPHFSNHLRKSNYSWSEEASFMEEMRSKLKKISVSPPLIMLDKCQLEHCRCCSRTSPDCCSWSAPPVYDNRPRLHKAVSTPA